MAVCSFCQTENPQEARYCSNCGAPLGEEVAAKPAESLTTSLETEFHPLGEPAAPEAEATLIQPPAPEPPAEPFGQQPLEPPAVPAVSPFPPAAPVSPYPSYMPRPHKDRSIALILEILPSLFGLFGFGWIYSGETTRGLIWLFGVLAWMVIAVIVTILTGGLACFCVIPINLVLVAISAYTLNQHTHLHTEIFGA